MMAIKNTPWTLSASRSEVLWSVVSQQFNKLRKQTIKLGVRVRTKRELTVLSMRSKGDVYNPLLKSNGPKANLDVALSKID